MLHPFLKSNLCGPLCLCGLLLLLNVGCKKKTDVTSEVSELQKAFPAAAAPVPAAATAPTAVNTAAANNPDPNAIVQAALTAVRTNDYAAGVIALQTVQRLPNVTQQQLMAVERAKQAMTAELLARAGRGDAKALADLAAIEKTRSQ
jgi:hypothetical protein